MLNIYIRRVKKDCIIDVKRYFNRKMKEEWFSNPRVREIIMNIDRSEVITGAVIKSPVFGIMSPDRLSSGCKATIMLEAIDGINIYGTRCGDNCVPDILEIASRKDITITLRHCMTFPKEGFEARIMETGEIVRSHKEFCDAYYDYKGPYRAGDE